MNLNFQLSKINFDSIHKMDIFKRNRNAKHNSQMICVFVASMISKFIRLLCLVELAAKWELTIDPTSTRLKTT